MDYLHLCHHPCGLLATFVQVCVCSGVHRWLSAAEPLRSGMDDRLLAEPLVGVFSVRAHKQACTNRRLATYRPTGARKKGETCSLIPLIQLGATPTKIRLASPLDKLPPQKSAGGITPRWVTSTIKSAGAITPRWVTCTIKFLLYWAGTQGGGISTTF